MAVNGMAQSMWSDIVASRFELLLFAVSLLGYMIVFMSRSQQKGSKEISSKADFALEVSQATDQVEDQDPEYIEQGSADVEDQHPEYIEEGSADVQSVIAELLDSNQFEKACDIFELNYSSFFDVDIDEDTERRLLMSALKCGRQSLAEHLLQTSQTDFAKHTVTIQQWWKRSSAKMSGSRVAHMHNVLDRMAQMFNELHPFEEEHSDAESTCALGEDSASDDGSSGDGDWDDSDLWS